MSTPVSFTIPEGYYLAGLEQVDNQSLWRAYLRKIERLPRIGDLHGAKGVSPQDAINKVHAVLEGRKNLVQTSMDDFLSLEDLDF